MLEKAKLVELWGRDRAVTVTRANLSVLLLILVTPTRRENSACEGETNSVPLCFFLYLALQL